MPLVAAFDAVEKLGDVDVCVVKAAPPNTSMTVTDASAIAIPMALLMLEFLKLHLLQG